MFDATIFPVLTDEPCGPWRRSWRFADGTRVPAVAGGSDEGDAGEGAGDEGAGTGDGGGAGTGSGKMLPQAEVDRLLASTRAEARRAAVKAIADDLGMDPKQAKEMIAAAEEARQAQMSDLEKREQAAAAREAKADEALRLALDAQRSADIRAELVTAGAPPEKIKRLVSLVRDELDPDDDDDTVVANAVKRVKDDVPELFGGAGDDGGKREWKPPPASDPRGRHGAGGKNGADPWNEHYQRGRARILGEKA